MGTLTSRPNLSLDLSLASFTKDELELIASLMYQTRLGFGSKYKQAARDIMDKIDSAMNDDDFCHTASLVVNPHIEVLDNSGWPIMTFPGTHYEILV